MIQVVVVAPTQAMRAGLRALLGGDSEISIAGEAPGLPGLEERALDIDVVVYAASGLPEAAFRSELQSALEKSEGIPALLLLSDDPGLAAELMGLPLRAWGFLSQDCSAQELAAAIHALHEGLLVGAPYLMEKLFASSTQTDPRQVFDPSGDALVDPLTPREIQVLQLLAQGLANKQIAGRLGISEHTVKFHVSSIYGKLNAVNRTEAVRIGARQGWITL